MLERIELVTKWYLRIVAVTYIFMFIPLTLTYLFVYDISKFRVDAFTLFKEDMVNWYFNMPLFEGATFSIPSPIGDFYILDLYFEYSIVPYIFWSFWVITFIRWIITGKHFWQ